MLALDVRGSLKITIQNCIASFASVLFFLMFLIIKIPLIRNFKPLMLDVIMKNNIGVFGIR